MATQKPIAAKRLVKDLSGVTIVGWTVIRFVGHTKYKAEKWWCRCQCGNEKEVFGGDLRNGKTKNCGCARARNLAASNLSHGMSKCDEYLIWSAMKDRCSNPNNISYHNYGERGIRVCDRWIQSFEAFLEDMGPRPSKKHELDRFPNNDGNYEPGNCRWATRREQCVNRRGNRILTHQGVSLTVSEWSSKLGIRDVTIHKRLQLNWPVSQILGEPVRKQYRNRFAKS